MRVYIIRHVETSNNLIQGQLKLTNDSEDYQKLRESDPGITDLGKIQGEIISDFMLKRKINPE